MRQGPTSKRGRGRSGGRRPYSNQINRSFESNGPDVKIRGTASHIHEKYQTLARDATVTGDRVGAENYLQHAEHYYRIVAAAQAQQLANQAQQQPGHDDANQPQAQGQPQARPEPPLPDEQPDGDNGNRAPESAVPPPDGGEQPEIAFPEASAPPPQPSKSRSRSPRGPKSSKPADIVAEVEANAETTTAKPKRARAAKSNGESADMAAPVEADSSDATPATS